MLRLARGALIAPVFASILRSVEKRVSNLLVDLLTIGSLLSFHRPGLTHSILESGAGNSTCFLLSKQGLGILTTPPFNQPRCRCSCVSQLPSLPAPRASLFPWLRAWGGGNPPSDTPAPHRATCVGEHQADRADPPASQSLGRGGAGARGVWLWLSRGVRSRPGKMPLGTDSPTSSGAALVGPRWLPLRVCVFAGWWGLISAYPATLRRGCALEVSAGFRKVAVAPSGGAAGDCHRAPARGEGGEPRRARPREEGCRSPGEQRL